jgi:hypothetical protein
MQLDREYLFIEEVENHYGFTKYDLIDYLNQDRLQLFAWVSLKSLYGFTRLDDNIKSSIIGCFDYKGIIEVSNEITPALLGLGEPSSLKKFKLIQKEHIQHWRDEQPHAFSYPNKDFLEYKFISEYQNLEIQPLVGALDSFERQAYNFELANSSENLTQQDFSGDEYTKHSLSIHPSSLRVKRSEIERIIAHNAKLSNKSKFSDSILEIDIIPIDELLSRIVKHGFQSIHEVMTALKQESKLPEDQRLYDVFKILLEVNSEEVIWIDAAGAEKKLSRKSVQNKLTKLKK